MAAPRKQGSGPALVEHRKRLRERGLTRVEVRVAESDAALVRAAAAALADPQRAEGARVVLRAHFGNGARKGLKDLLESAPLEDVDLTRSRDVGRLVDL
ncbi:MAG: hypothetical protein AB7F35_01445 [Acetobacteraceae bacterium]